MSSSVRALLAPLKPREHALWGWVLVPLLAAVALAPGLVTAAGALAVVAGFLAHQGLGRLARRPHDAAARRATAGALAAAGVAGGVTSAASGRPLQVLGVLAALGAISAVTAWRFRGVHPRHPALELGGIAAFAGLGALLALAGGAPVVAAVAVQAAVATWFAVGWWWVKSQLAEVMPRREVPAWAPAVPLVGLPGALAACTLLGAPGVGVIPCLYASRAALHAPPAGPQDARRVGLTELGWSVGAALLMVALA